MEKIHIVITAEGHCGKEKIIDEFIRKATCPVYGFVTRNLPADEKGFHPIFIHPAGMAERICEKENQIGSCDTKIHNINTEVFDVVGTPLIKAAKPDGVIVMDELGFMESKALKFSKAAMNALDGDIPVIAVVKDRKDIPFVNDIRNHPKAENYSVTADTTEEEWQKLLELCLEKCKR